MVSFSFSFRGCDAVAVAITVAVVVKWGGLGEVMMGGIIRDIKVFRFAETWELVVVVVSILCC